MSLQAEIKKNNHKAFRRLYMKRRELNGEYETDWQLIPDRDVINYGSISYSIDDIKPDFYKIESVGFKLTNYDGDYGPETDDKSFFYQKLTRAKTLIKFEGGYEDKDGNEFPTNASLFVGVLDWDMIYKSNPELSLKAKSLTSVFEDFPSDQIPSLNSSQTAIEILTKIRDFQDAGSTFYFQKFITSGGWYMTAGSTYYDISTGTTLQSKSVWQLMQNLANAENAVVYIDRSGDFYFKPKSDITTTADFHFSGIGDDDKSWGHNILKDGITVDENIRKVYNRIKIKFNKDDTTTSYYIRNETWQWGDSSSSFLYGVKELKYENTFLESTTAQTIGETLYDEFVRPKNEIKIKAKFIPHIMVQDRCTVTYKKQRYFGDALWGAFLWGHAVWGERLGYNIDLNNENVRLLKVSHNLDNFTTNVTSRSVE